MICPKVLPVIVSVKQCVSMAALQTEQEMGEYIVHRHEQIHQLIVESRYCNCSQTAYVRVRATEF